MFTIVVENENELRTRDYAKMRAGTVAQVPTMFDVMETVSDLYNKTPVGELADFFYTVYIGTCFDELVMTLTAEGVGKDMFKLALNFPRTMPDGTCAFHEFWYVGKMEV